MFYVSSCLIVKDENTYLDEFVKYHLKIGIEHFYIYDNGSAIPVRDTLSNFVKAGIVDVIDFPGKGVQVSAYNHCLHSFGKTTKWLFFHDTDEFVVLHQKNSLKDFLKDYEKFGGVGINWLVFGSNGHKTRPTGLQMEAFTKRSLHTNPVNSHIKSVVQPIYTLRAGRDPHHFIYDKGYYCVNEFCAPISGPFSPNSTTKVQLNHYFLRSEEEFLEKIRRGRGDGAGTRGMQEFIDLDRDSNLVEDLSILKNLPI